MNGIKCDVCKGKGYILSTRIVGGALEPIKIWCEKCKGTGHVKYEGDRTGIEWEGE